MFVWRRGPEWEGVGRKVGYHGKEEKAKETRLAYEYLTQGR